MVKPKFVLTAFCCLSFLLFAPAVFALDLVEIKTDKYSFYINPYKLQQLDKQKTDNFSVYVNLEKKAEPDKFDNLYNLEFTFLRISVLPLKNSSVYITFPDGGNMLVFLDNRIDSEELIPVLDKILTKQKKEAYLMKILGWKPRIDRLVITSLLDKKDGVIKAVIDKFNVKEIVTPGNADYALSDKIRHIKLKPDEELDLIQTISPVKLLSYGTKNSNDKFLILRLSYIDFSFLLLPETPESIQKGLIEKYINDIKSTVMITAESYETLSKEFLSVVDPGFLTLKDGYFKFVTGGHLLFVSEDIPPSGMSE